MLWACINLQKGRNNTFECFVDQPSVFSVREGKQKLKFAIFGYFIDVIILVFNNARNPSEKSELVSSNIFKDLCRLKNDTRCLETLFTMQERICRLALSAEV
jgi:hypothetical protein